MRVSGLIARVRRTGGDLLHLCYPAICAACEAPAPQHAFLCESCDADLTTLLAAGRCDRCAMPVSEEGAPCPWCEGQGIAHFDRMARLGILSDPLKHLIHRIKYAGKWPVAEKLADRLLSSGRLDATLRETDVLLPVPLHWYRHMQRGFNQADVIATRLAARWKGDRIKVVRPVVRLVATETQTHLHGRAKREENLKHAFGLIRPQAIAGKRVTIVDDVTTTGATLLSLARTIKSAGPASMNAITLAIADPDGKQFEVV